jgi:hypothetical protein
LRKKYASEKEPKSFNIKISITYWMFYLIEDACRFFLIIIREKNVRVISVVVFF